MTTHEVTLDIDGVAIDVFDQYTIRSSMIEHGNPFTFTLWRSETASAAWSRVLEAAKCETPVSLRIDGALQLVGCIETIAGEASVEGGASITVSGTDVAGLAMRWDADPKTVLRETTLQESLKQLFAPFGLNVVLADAKAILATQAQKRRSGHYSRPSKPRPQQPPRDDRNGLELMRDTFLEGFGEVYAAANKTAPEFFDFVNAFVPDSSETPETVSAPIGPLVPLLTVARQSRPRPQPVDRFRPQIGEKVWQAAERLCKRLGYLMWAAPWDTDTIAIIVDRPRYDADPIYSFTRRNVGGTQDGNILGGGHRVSTAEVPSEINLYGHGSRGDRESSRVGSRVVNDRWDTRFVRTPVRTKPVHARTETGRDAKPIEQQTSRMLDSAMARHSIYQCRVRGHDQAYQGDAVIRLIYAINSMARVRDDVFGIDSSYLIDTVEFQGSRTGGTFTTCTMHKPGSIRCIPERGAL